MNKHTGFTLMEAVLALVLLSVGMLGLAGAFSQIVKANAGSRQKQMAALLATTKLTELCKLPITEMNEHKGTFSEPFGHYSWQTQFDYRTGGENIADIWLEVRHDSGISVTLWTKKVINNVR